MFTDSNSLLENNSRLHMAKGDKIIKKRLHTVKAFNMKRTESR